MKILVYVSLAAMMALTFSLSTQHGQISAPVKVSNASAESGQYQAFLLAADRYMKSYTGGAATIYWSTIRNHPEAPKVNMPPDWRIVVAGDKSWVACTPMSEQAANIITQYASMSGHKINPYYTGQSFLAVDTTDWNLISKCQ
jgi:hypothetical protein